MQVGFGSDNLRKIRFRSVRAESGNVTKKLLNYPIRALFKAINSLIERNLG